MKLYESIKTNLKEADLNNPTLQEIYDNLQAGISYGEDMDKEHHSWVTYPYFDEVLYLIANNGVGREVIGWKNYGSSANPNTIEDLDWILTKIFKMTPEEFTQKYIKSTESKLMETEKLNETDEQKERWAVYYFNEVGPDYVVDELYDFADTAEEATSMSNELKEKGLETKIVHQVYDENTYDWEDTDGTTELKEMDNSEGLTNIQFVEYCEGKVANLGTVDVSIDNEAIPVRIAFEQKIRDYGNCKVLNGEDTMDKLDSDGDNLEFVTEEGKYISTPMINPITLAGRMEFDKIDEEFYKAMLANWDEIKDFFEAEELKEGSDYWNDKFGQEALDEYKNNQDKNGIPKGVEPFKVGDPVYYSYLSDNNKHNRLVGNIEWLRKYKYYPFGHKGDSDTVIYKWQGSIKYPDGSTESIGDAYAKGGGVTSPLRIAPKEFKPGDKIPWDYKLGEADAYKLAAFEIENNVDPSLLGEAESLKETNTTSPYIDISEIIKYAEEYLCNKLNCSCSITRLQDGQYQLTIPNTHEAISSWLKVHEKFNESAGYKDTLGGTPEDYISDIQSIKDKLNELDTDKFATKRAYEVWEQFDDICDYQMQSIKDRFLNESYNYIGKDTGEAGRNNKSHMEHIYTVYDCFGEVDTFKSKEDAEKYIEEHKDDEMYTEEYGCSNGPEFRIDEDDIEVNNKKIVIKDDLKESEKKKLAVESWTFTE